MDRSPLPNPDPFSTSPPLVDAAAKAAARAARARKRKWRRRLAWTGGILALLLAVGVVLSLGGITGGKFVFNASNADPYSDSLATNASGWPQQNGCGERDGAYHISPTNTQFAQMCFAPAGRYSDLDEEVTATQTSGPAEGEFGLVFRLVDSGDGYIFIATGDGRAFLAKIASGQITPISDAWPYSADAYGQPRTLRVVAQGAIITCYINGARVGTLTDSTYANGGVGLMAGSGGVDVAFTDFSVKSA